MDGSSSGNGSNRTFMELKFGLTFLKLMVMHRSNRTFMELKSAQKLSARIKLYLVLIVPLWN